MNPSNSVPPMPPLPPTLPAEGGDQNDNARPAKKKRTTNTNTDDNNIPINVSNDDDDEGQPPPANNYASGGLEHGATAEVASGPAEEVAGAATTNGSTRFNLAAFLPANANVGGSDFMAQVEQSDPARVLARKAGFVGDVKLIEHVKDKNAYELSFFSHNIQFTKQGVVTHFTKHSKRYADDYFINGIGHAFEEGYAKEGGLDLGVLVPDEFKQAADLANFPPGEVAFIRKISHGADGKPRCYTRLLHLKQGIISNSILDFCSKTNIDNNLIHTAEILEQRLRAGRNGFNFKGDDPTLVRTHGNGYKIYLPERNEEYTSFYKALDAANIIQQDFLRSAVHEVAQSRNQSLGSEFHPQWLQEQEEGISYDKSSFYKWVKLDSNRYRNMKYTDAKSLIKHLHRTVTDEEYRTNERLAALMFCILNKRAVGDFASEIDGVLNLLNPVFIMEHHEDDDDEEEDTTPALAFNRQDTLDDESVEGDDARDVSYTVVQPNTIIIARAQSLTYPEGSIVFEEAGDEELVLTRFDGIGIADAENVIALKGYKGESGEPEDWLILGADMSEAVGNNIFVITSPGPNAEPVFYDEMEEELDQLEDLLGALEGSSGELPGALEGSSGELPGALEGSSGELPGALEGSSGGVESVPV